MELTVLGCRSGMPGDGRPSSGYLVDAGGATVLLDCGPGIATALSGVTTPGRLDAVVISHMHADHCYDLLPLGKALLYERARAVAVERGVEPLAALEGLDEGAGRVPLWVPPGSRAVLDRLAALFPVRTWPALDRAFELAFDVREYAPHDVVALGERGTMALHPLRHSVPNCGVRISSPTGSLAYTGDTGPTAALGPLAEDVDLLLAEATLDTTDHTGHGHLSGHEAGAVAAEHGARSLVITHFTTGDPAVLERRRAAAAATYGGPVQVAAPGCRYVPAAVGHAPSS